jgi:hypothetical protein
MFQYPALYRITAAGYPYNHLSEKAGDTLKNKANDPALSLCSTTDLRGCAPLVVRSEIEKVLEGIRRSGAG